MLKKTSLTVNARIKRFDPKNPPKIVMTLDDPSCVLNSCIPANVIKQRMDETTHDTEVGNVEPENIKNKVNHLKISVVK